jgi:hypothetical protein
MSIMGSLLSVAVSARLLIDRLVSRVAFHGRLARVALERFSKRLLFAEMQAVRKRWLLQVS